MYINIIRTELELREAAKAILGDAFNAKYEERYSLNKGGKYYRVFGLLNDFSLIEYGDGELAIIRDSKAVYEDENEFEGIQSKMIDHLLQKHGFEARIEVL